MSMRSVVVAASLVILSCSLVTGAHARVRLGFEAGLNQAKATWAIDPDILDLDTDYRPAWSAGAALDLPLAAQLSIGSGLRYIEYSEQAEFNLVGFAGGARFERHWAWRYLAIPVHLRFRPAFARGFFVGAGPEVAYLLTMRHEESVWLSGIIVAAGRPAAGPAGTILEDVGTFFSDPRGAYRPWNLALSGGVGYEFPLVGHTGIIEARYAHGLLDIARSEALERQTRGFEALVGFLW
jgi:hypothetical protein